MFQKVVVLCLLLHLSSGQVSQPSSNGGANPFVFDLPPLKLEPLQIRLNPASSSLILLNQNQSIPVETLPSSTNQPIATTQPQPPTQLPRPQTFTPFTSFAPTANPSPASTPSQQSQAQTLFPISFQPFTQLTSAPNQAQTLRSQIFRPFVFAPAAPQTFSFTPNANPFLIRPLSQESPQPQPAAQSPAKPATPVQQNSIPKESSVTYERSNLEAILKDLATYVPIQLPGQTLIFNQAQAQPNGQQAFQTDDKNTRFMQPVILPPVSIPVDQVRMVAVDVSQQQTEANNQAHANIQTVQEVTAAPAAPTAAPQPTQPVQAQNPAVVQAQLFQPLAFQPLPTVAPLPKLSPLPASLSAMRKLNPLPAPVPWKPAVSPQATAAPIQAKPTFKPLSFRSVPFQTIASQKPSQQKPSQQNTLQLKQVSIPKVQALAQPSNRKPNGSNKMVSQHLTFGQNAKQNSVAKPTQAPPARPTPVLNKPLEFGARLKNLS